MESEQEPEQELEQAPEAVTVGLPQYPQTGPLEDVSIFFSCYFLRSLCFPVASFTISHQFRKLYNEAKGE
jgi:hypothetical protein